MRLLQSRLGLALVLSCTVAACAPEVDTELRESRPWEAPEEADAPETLAVVGGTTAAPCSWPSTVRVNGCTGTLIHSRVVTTAAHCLSGTSARVVFTGGPAAGGSFSVTGRCRAGARGSSGVSSGRDWGYCVLPEDERVKRMPVTPPLVGCEAERFLKPGASAWIVGFGNTGPDGRGGGVKRQVEVRINRVSGGLIDVGDRYVGACNGDSGGPLYIKLVDANHDWGWRVVGATSGPGAARCKCTCSTAYVNVAQHVGEIERTEGIDVTPCTDASGAWAPTAACRSFPAAPERATGTYPACSVPTTQVPIETCGPNTAARFDAPPAATP